MTQDQIQRERERLCSQIDDLKYQMDILRGQMAALQNRCKHPNMHSYTCQGDRGQHCPDCGYDR